MTFGSGTSASAPGWRPETSRHGGVPVVVRCGSSAGPGILETFVMRGFTVPTAGRNIPSIPRKGMLDPWITFKKCSLPDRLPPGEPSSTFFRAVGKVLFRQSHQSQGVYGERLSPLLPARGWPGDGRVAFAPGGSGRHQRIRNTSRHGRSPGSLSRPTGRDRQKYDDRRDAERDHEEHPYHRH